MAVSYEEEEYDNRWSLHDEFSKVFKVALQRTFADFPHLSDEHPFIVPLTHKEIGDYQCNNILRIWPKLRDTGSYKDCTSIGEDIVGNLPASDMIEKCNVHGPGFIPFKLSDQWIAKSIHNMLIDGIDTWAPKLPVKRAIVDFSSRNIAEDMHMGHLRSTFIGDAIARVLEFSRVDVIRRNHVEDCGTKIGMLIALLFERFPNGEINDLTIGELEVLSIESKKRFDGDVEFKKSAEQALVRLLGADERYQNARNQICQISREGFQKVFQLLGVRVEDKVKSFYNPYLHGTLELLNQKGLIEESEGDQVIFIEETELYVLPLTEGIKLPLTVVKRDGGLGYALTDLTALRYQLEAENAEWILYVSDIPQRVHTEMCINAAKHAKWLAPGRQEFPRGSYVGFGRVQGDDLKSFNTRSTQVSDLLEEAKSRCKATIVERAKAHGWTAEELDRTAEALGYGAVKYADLKNHRLKKYTFNFDQMFSDTENTAVHLLLVHARICSIVSNSGKDIEELKKIGEIKLETDEERELGLHLLKFTDDMERTCKFALPHILCAYLYDLSKKATRLYSNFSVHQVVSEEMSRLLLFEATAVVMKKCFHLLGITPVYNIW